MKVLIIGGTGKVGTPLVRRLTEHGAEVTVVVRSGERAALVERPAIAVVGDILQDPQTCLSMFAGVDSVFMLNKASASEATEGVLAVRLAQEAGVQRFVYQTAHLLDELAYLPHLAAKVAIRKAIELSGMDYTFIAPNHFYQNDAMVKQPLITQGVYLTPLGPIGCWGVDVGDIAAAAAAVLTTEGHGGRNYNVLGPRTVTGAEAADSWAAVLDRPVRYGGIEAWRDYTRPFMPPWMHFDLSLMYVDFEKRGMLGTERDVERLTTLIGRAPKSFDAYAAEQARNWGAVSDGSPPRTN